MKRLPVFSVMALGACLVLILMAWAANGEPLEEAAPPSPAVADNVDAVGQAGEPETQAPSSAVLDQARALIDAGRFEEAIMVLRPLLGQEPVDGNVLFLYGLASLEASQRPGREDEERELLLNEAIAAFHAMLVEAPGLVRVRLELARAFYLKGEDNLASCRISRK